MLNNNLTPLQAVKKLNQNKSEFHGKATGDTMKWKNHKVQM